MQRFVWLTVLCWVLSAPLCLHAEQSSDYDQALEAALDAHAHGDLTSARTNMERAHALSPSARTLRGLAIIAHAQGRHVDTVVLCDAALSSEVLALSSTLRASVEALRARSLREVARVAFSVVPAGAEVQIDGLQPSRDRDGALLLTPGVHRLVVSAPYATTYEVALDAVAGETAAVHVALAAASTPPGRALAELPIAPESERVSLAAPPSVSADPSPTTRPPRWTPRRRNLTLAAGALGALGGGALLIAASLKFDNVDDACRAQPSETCSRAEAGARLDDAHVLRYARSGAVLLAIGGATAVTVLVLELWSHRTGERATARLTPTGVLLQASF